MNALFLLIPLSLLLILVAGAAFLWAVNSGQFDDLDTPANQPLDEAGPVEPDRDGH